MGSIRIFKRWGLDATKKTIMKNAADGIEAACAETTSWIKNDVLLDQKYVPHNQFPDVKPATRSQKNKRGEKQVLIQTGHLKDSWNFQAKGLEGVVGSGSEGYFKKIYSRWKIDELWREEHGDEALEIVRRAVTRKL